MSRTDAGQGSSDDEPTTRTADLPTTGLPPEMASLAPELAEDPWEDWGSAEDFAPDLSSDEPPA